jgi:hypothetical protein
MTWLTKLRTYLGHDEPLLNPPTGEGSAEAKHAMESALAAVNDAQNRRDQIREVTASLSDIRARNHFGESIELAMMRKGRHA